MKFSAILLALVAAASAAPSESPNLRIIGGHDAEPGQFPYQVSLKACFLGIICWHICGATIISDSHILTAAHCYDPQYTYRALIGVNGLSEHNADRQYIVVENWKIHPSFIDDGKPHPYDIAVAELAQSVRFSDRVKQAKLPLPNDDVKGEAVLSGWGSIDNNDDMPDTLQTVTIPVLTIAECSNAFNALFPYEDLPLDPDSNVCTGPLSGGVSACSGDSGGPLTQDGKIVGIVSWGVTPCGKVGAPSVFTKVSSYVGWIEEKVEDAMEEAPFKLAYL